MDQLKVRRFGAMSAVAGFALIALAACGGSASIEGDVTRVPEMSEAAAQATNEAALAGTPGVAGEASPAAAAQEETAPAAAAPAAEPVEIDSIDIAFEPKNVTIPANSDVTITLPNKGVTAHNFSIDALNISVDLVPGETKEVVINAPAGTYEFYCNVPGHKDAGMVGTLTVAEGVAAEAPAAPEASPPTATVEATPEAADATPETTGAAAAETPAEAAQAAAEPVTIVSKDIFFEPKDATIPANTDVTFVLPNEGVTAHNFSIDALNISVDLAPGETQEVVINAQAGTYEFYCNVPGHKEAGMIGTLTVE